MCPGGIGFAVVHHHGVPPEQAGDAEGQRLVIHGADIHDAREAERSPSDGQREAVHHVIDDLMVIQVPGGIGHGCALRPHDSDYLLPIGHDPAGLFAGDKLGIVDSRYGVTGQYTVDRIAINYLRLETGR